MANEKKAAAKDSVAVDEKKYAIRHTIVLGKGETREERSSGFVTASEVGGEATIEQLLALGAIGDPDAPIRPSEAAEHRARAVLIDIAKRGKLLTSEGERYTFGGKVYAGADALTEIPLAALSDAILAAMNV